MTLRLLLLFQRQPNCEKFLNLSDSQPHDFELLLRKNVKVRGKLTGDLEGIGADSSATGWTENLHPTRQLALDEHRWLPKAFSSIKPDGTFELLLPPGAAKLNYQWSQVSAGSNQRR